MTASFILSYHRYMKEFTREQLAACNGLDGTPAYFAYQGRVYDGSQSFLWRRGRHWARHFAGLDLTGALEEAPHGEDLLERLPIIGILID